MSHKGLWQIATEHQQSTDPHAHVVDGVLSLEAHHDRDQQQHRDAEMAKAEDARLHEYAEWFKDRKARLAKLDPHKVRSVSVDVRRDPYFVRFKTAADATKGLQVAFERVQHANEWSLKIVQQHVKLYEAFANKLLKSEKVGQAAKEFEALVLHQPQIQIPGVRFLENSQGRDNAFYETYISDDAALCGMYLSYRVVHPAVQQRVIKAFRNYSMDSEQEDWHDIVAALDNVPIVRMERARLQAPAERKAGALEFKGVQELGQFIDALIRMAEAGQSATTGATHQAMTQAWDDCFKRLAAKEKEAKASDRIASEEVEDVYELALLQYLDAAPKRNKMPSPVTVLEEAKKLVQNLTFNWWGLGK